MNILRYAEAKPPQRSAAAPAAAKPVAIEHAHKDARKEVNEVRSWMVAGGGSSLSKSPLQGSFLTDANHVKRLNVLDLNPGSGSASTKDVNAKHGKLFYDWKAARVNKGADAGAHPVLSCRRWP